jgi:hypothetical protein
MSFPQLALNECIIAESLTEVPAWRSDRRLFQNLWVLIQIPPELRAPRIVTRSTTSLLEEAPRPPNPPMSISL